MKLKNGMFPLTFEYITGFDLEKKIGWGLSVLLVHVRTHPGSTHFSTHHCTADEDEAKSEECDNHAASTQNRGGAYIAVTRYNERTRCRSSSENGQPGQLS